MNKYLKLILMILLFVVLIVGAKFGYDYLSENYIPEDLIKDENEDENKDVNDKDIIDDYLSDFEIVDSGEVSGEVLIEKTPDFEVHNENGEVVKLSDYFGKPIIVNFWASWCGPCKYELPEFEKAYKKYGDEIEFLMVNLTDGYTDTVEGVKEFVKENNYTFPVYFDVNYDASNTYGVSSIPETLFINKDGELVNAVVGAINENYLEAYISRIR